MKIGIDIDNVISNFNDTLLTEYLLHDKELRNSGIINKKLLTEILSVTFIFHYSLTLLFKTLCS